MRLPLLLIAMSLAFGACADDSISVFIIGNVAPEQSDDGCTYSAASDAFVRQGTWDIQGSMRFAGSYSINAMVVNQIQARGSTVASEPNGVHIQRAEVTLQDLGGTPIDFAGLPNPFSVPASTYIPPADGLSPGRSVVSIVAIPPDYGASLFVAESTSTTIVASVRLVGETNGHIDIHAAAFEYPIVICAGCLFTCPISADDVSLACIPGQDQGSVDPDACSM